MSKKYINVPGRLHNVALDAQGNPQELAGANEILDDNLGKDQETINGELTEELSDLDSRVSDTEDAVAAEVSRAQGVEATKADKNDTYTKAEVNNIASAFTSQKYATVEATAQTTAATDVLPATGATDTLYRVSMWDGNAYNPSVYSEYTWNGSTYIHMDTKSSVGEVFDITDYNSGTKYADLAAALDGGNNIPQSLRKGGMSVKFVQSSDNNYIRYNLIADEFTTDTTKWAVDDNGVYVENPEFVYVKTDKDNKILWAIKTDGGIYYGAGCPQQVKDYIEEKISSLSLDEYEDIVAFLSDYLGSDTTLKAMIDSINERIPEIIGSPEFLEVTTDSEDKVLEGIREDGTKVIGANLNVGGSASINGDIRILGNMEVSGVSYKVVENPEYLAAWVDAEGKVIFGLKADGKTYIGDADFLNEIKHNQDAIGEIKAILGTIDTDALSSITEIESPEFIEAKTDSEGKLLAGRTNDGAAFENVGFSTPKVSINGHFIENIEDQEGRSEITTDSEGKIISYRNSDGVKHEEVGIKTVSLKADSIVLPEDALNQVDERIDNHVASKSWYMPKFGSVVFTQETFYLTAAGWSSYEDDVELIQDHEDTDENARNKVVLSHFYIKGTQTILDFYRAKEVSDVDGHYYVTASLEGGEVVPTSIEVRQVKDVPPYKAWTVDKEEHQCLADIDFGTYYSKTNVPVTLKYQGNSTLLIRKRGFRITFYKKNDYKKKDKKKFGEMLRLSGFNMKSYLVSPSRLSNPMSSISIREMYETRGKECYPWNADSIPYNGATGFIEEFPIATYFGDEFFGLQFFGLKKDEKNYMLDGDDDASGIFVSGEVHGSWESTWAAQWADEMGVEGRVLAYPELGDDSVSVETAAAMNEFFKYTKGFYDGTAYIGTDKNVYSISELTDVEGTLYVTATLDEGAVVPSSVAVELKDFDNSMFEERVDIVNWIDYWICCQVFQLIDNTFHNVILYSGADKKKYYLFFYDIDQSLYTIYNKDLVDICRDANIPIDFWEKFVDEYKDEIVNRYVELRKSVLSYENVKSTFESYISDIPDSVIAMEHEKWGNGNPALYESSLDILKKRLEWLDETQFNTNL